MIGRGERLAIHGGDPVRTAFLPYGHQRLEEEDIRAVEEVLHAEWLTTGPKVSEFEQAFAGFVGTPEAVAVSSGTAALHAAMYAVGIQPGDEVIVPPMTFAASANCIVFMGGIPVFADVGPSTLLLDPTQVESKITYRTKAIVAVDYAGQPCEYDRLREIARHYGLLLVADACHSLGGRYRDKPVGSCADLNTFSFHPVKHITTGEGGMITTHDAEMAKMMRLFRNHGITTDQRQRKEERTWFYEMVDLGYNYRLTDFQCALGISQLRKLTDWVKRRQEIARSYREAFADIGSITPLGVRPDIVHAYHLYVIHLNLPELRVGREDLFRALLAEGIGVNVHYIPVHLHPFYQMRFGTAKGMCPVAETAYEEIMSIPISHGMTDQDVNDVIRAVRKVMYAYVK